MVLRQNKICYILVDLNFAEIFSLKVITTHTTAGTKVGMGSLNRTPEINKPGSCLSVLTRRQKEHTEQRKMPRNEKLVKAVTMKH